MNPNRALPGCDSGAAVSGVLQSIGSVRHVSLQLFRDFFHFLCFSKKMPLEFELCPGRVVGGDHPCFIIAEIGQNHQGDIEIAKKMIKMAKVKDLLICRFNQHEQGTKW